MANHKIWSEHQAGRRRSTDDIMIGVNQGLDSMDVVVKHTQAPGVTSTYDCGHCGRQTQVLTSWPEMACYYRGQKIKGTSATNQGVLVRMRCARCRRVNKILWGWQEVDAAVRESVRLRWLPLVVLTFQQR